MKYLRTYENNYLRNKIESIIWNADNLGKTIELFWEWADINAPNLFKYDTADVTNHMTNDEINRFLKHYELVKNVDKYNL